MLARKNWSQRRASGLTTRTKTYAALIFFAFLVFLWTPDPFGKDSDAYGQSVSDKELFNALLSKHPFASKVNKTSTEMCELIHKDHSKILGFGMEGRALVDNAIMEIAKRKKDDVVVIMEVGVWYGQSVARWLAVSPKVRAIAVDPFSPKGYPGVTLPDDVQRHLRDPSFNRALTEYTISKEIKDAAERTLIVGGFHPQDSQFILDAHSQKKGPAVDLFYLDGGKTDDPKEHMQFVRDSFQPVLKEFPNVVIAGDDWGHGNHAKLFQETVIDICHKNGRVVYVMDDRTWISVKKQQLREFKKMCPTCQVH